MVIRNDFSRSDGGWQSSENNDVTPVRFDAFAKIIGIQSLVIIVVCILWQGEDAEYHDLICLRVGLR